MLLIFAVWYTMLTFINLCIFFVTPQMNLIVQIKHNCIIYLKHFIGKNFHPRLKGNMVCIILENNDKIKINISIVVGACERPAVRRMAQYFNKTQRAYCYL